MRLADTQKALYGLITGHPGSAERIIAPNERLTAAERVEIYTRQYPARMHESLVNDFPKLAKILGEERFWDLVLDYTRAHPSDHHDLGRFGRNLVAFLRGRRGSGALADLAALEWARAEVFVERDAAEDSPEALRTLPPDQFAHARLRFVPALRLLELRHDVLPLWGARRKPWPKPARKKTSVLVWRKDWSVLHLALSGAEARALASARAGEPLGVVCAAFGREKDPSRAAFGALARWSHERLIAQVEPPARG